MLVCGDPGVGKSTLLMMVTDLYLYHTMRCSCFLIIALFFHVNDSPWLLIVLVGACESSAACQQLMCNTVQYKIAPTHRPCICAIACFYIFPSISKPHALNPPYLSTSLPHSLPPSVPLSRPPSLTPSPFYPSHQLAGMLASGAPPLAAGSSHSDVIGAGTVDGRGNGSDLGGKIEGASDSEGEGVGEVGVDDSWSTQPLPPPPSTRPVLYVSGEEVSEGPSLRGQELEEWKKDVWGGKRICTGSELPVLNRFETDPALRIEAAWPTALNNLKWPVYWRICCRVSESVASLFSVTAIELTEF